MPHSPTIGWPLRIQNARRCKGTCSNTSPYRRKWNTAAMKRELHHLTGHCHNQYCQAEAFAHNKLYWHDKKETITSAHFCRNCWNIRLNKDLMHNMYYGDVAIQHFTTLRECKLDLITRKLNGK
jgi:hypothetical protein